MFSQATHMLLAASAPVGRVLPCRRKRSARSFRTYGTHCALTSRKPQRTLGNFFGISFSISV